MFDKSKPLWAALVVVLLLATVYIRSRVLDTPLERDEGEFAYAGQLILHGVPAYTLCCNIKLPGANAVYAAMMALFGETAAGIHFGFILVNLACVILFYYVARRMLDWPGLFIGCASFLLLMNSPVLLALAGHSTHLVVLGELAGILALMRARESGRVIYYFVSGACFCVSLLCKQPGLFFCLFGLAVVVRDCFVNRDVPFQNRGRRLLAFCLGGLTPMAVTIVEMWRTGTLSQFFLWTYFYASVHSSMLPPDMGVRHLRMFFSAGYERWLFVAGGVCLAVPWLERNRWEKKFMLTVLYAMSWAGVVAGFYFSPHYFIVLVPANCLLLGNAVDAVSNVCAKHQWRLVSCVIPAITILFVVAVFRQNRGIWFQLPPRVIAMQLYPADPFVECMTMAQYINEHSTPRDRIEVIGSEPEVYFYSRRLSASGYVYMYDLMGAQPYASFMQLDFIHDIEKSKPKFLLMVNNRSSWTEWPKSDRTIFGWTRQYTPKHYDLVGAASIEPNATEYFWESEAPHARVNPEAGVYLFRRKDNDAQ